MCHLPHYLRQAMDLVFEILVTRLESFIATPGSVSLHCSLQKKLVTRSNTHHKNYAQLVVLLQQLVHLLYLPSCSDINLLAPATSRLGGPLMMVRERRAALRRCVHLSTQSPRQRRARWPATHGGSRQQWKRETRERLEQMAGGDGLAIHHHARPTSSKATIKQLHL